MRKLFGTGIILILAFIMCAPVLANPFADAPSNHWAYDAVQQLSAKGIVEGYPDGQYKGDRAATRYELAMVIARVIAKLEQVQASIPPPVDLTPYATKSEVQGWLANYATKEELAVLRRLIQEYKDELDKLGVRVNRIEEDLGKLEKRVTELERVKVSGDFYGTLQYIRTKSATSTFGVENPQDFTYFYTYFGAPMLNGAAVTMAMKLNITAIVSENVLAGTQLYFFSKMGSTRNALFWGAPAPWGHTAWNNEYLHDGVPIISNTLSTLNAQVYNTWLNFKGKNYTLKMTMGCFYPEYFSPLFFRPPVYAYRGAMYIPLNGFNVNLKTNNDFFFEFSTAVNLTSYGKRHSFYGNPFLIDGDPTISGRESMLTGFSLGVDKPKKYYFSFSYLVMTEKQALSGFLPSPLPAPLPYQGYESRWGLEGNYYFSKNIIGFAEYTRSNLKDMTTDSSLTEGRAFRAGAVLRNNNGLQLSGQYLRISPNYAPMGFYRNTDVPTNDFLSYEENQREIKNFDFIDKNYSPFSIPLSGMGPYMNNRVGTDLTLRIPFCNKRGVLALGFLNLKQINESVNFGIPGVTPVTNFDQLFPTPSAPDGTLGALKAVYGRLLYRYNEKGGTIKLHHRNNHIVRESMGIGDYINQRLSVTGFIIEHPLDPKWTVLGAYTYIRGKGYYLSSLQLLPNVDSTHSVPVIGVAYKPNKDLTLDCNLTWYKYTNDYNPQSNYTNLRVLSEIRFNF